MRSHKTIMLAGLASLGFASAAFGADLGYAPPPMVQQAPVVIEEASGWYLRGDVGVSVNSNRSFIYENFPATGITYGPNEMSNSFMIGIGAGYYWNSWLRTDITVDYRTGATYYGRDIYPGGATFVTGTNTITTTMSSVVGLFNVYADIGTWYGITPYVGAGVGLSYNILGLVTDRGWNAAGSATGGTGPGGNTTNFAWALMAGATYDISSRAKLDLGYRYLNYGHYKASGKIDCFNDPACPPAIFKSENMDSHEFRLGIRYMIGAYGEKHAHYAQPVSVARRPRSWHRLLLPSRYRTIVE